jgi:hypothetical protein
LKLISLFTAGEGVAAAGSSFSISILLTNFVTNFWVDFSYFTNFGWVRINQINLVARLTGFFNNI